ncbi:class I SAM-dependent methyltransferase [Lacibacter luteus]|uniref:Class I SAM-dependent methyltransferase n=1 Tax=Lacibacter luteus TaxID=2508719 RepID=A0A4Q1CJR6_9BACT|nr:class I SAM-dependent methyltransferase [Lacibacter luteus]RXK60572.1 class I SAM-dependent methyltransferase [Lacibacter luteus]
MHFLEQNKYSDKWFRSDKEFNDLYPYYIKAMAFKHWTALPIARKAADFLAAEPGGSILDIGCGVGKFCLAAAKHKPGSFYYGVEQRKWLLHYAEQAKTELELENVHFIEGNFTQLDFDHYDHFYSYNPFYENLAGTDKIDDSIDYSVELYNYYNRFLYRKLQQKPPGTRLATFHSLEEEIPSDYHLVGSAANELLKFWIKE